jgi:hypothetical protein
MGDDEAALQRLWREKRGEVDLEDLSGNLIVQLGLATEKLNRRWYQAQTGRVVTDVQQWRRHPTVRWMAATLDGRVEGGDVFESKFMLPWSFSEETAAQKYMPQLQHNMWVVAARAAVLSVITGGGKWVEIETHADPLYQHLILTAERKFWRCVETGEPPVLFGVAPPKPRIEAVRIVDMTSSNAWSEFAGIFSQTQSAHLEHEQAKAELKGLVPEDAHQAIGHGVRARRSKSGAISFDLLEGEVAMQRSSDSIGGLAAALAKAQSELVNPEKSLVATIRAENRGGGERTFRYAPLSGGLDIVRKTLGHHEIAAIQTTSLDQTAGIINLTTVLAHASGEWIGSDWPVCPIGEIATPHRMGAALTYARRYALFTLVGIAGEDDLDAPDLVPPTRQSEPEKPKTNREKLNRGRLNGTAPTVAPRQRQSPAESKLEAEASAALCDRLLAELNDLTSGDDAAIWAHRRLIGKNKLADADAHRVEEMFRARIRTFAVDGIEDPLAPVDRKPKGQAQLAEIDKSALALPEQRRIRDRDHVRSVSKQACLICGRQPSDAHHLRFAQHRALGRKVSDEFTVPLCRGHHRELHRCGDEAAWWTKLGLDPIAAARTLWLKSHPLPERTNGPGTPDPTGSAGTSHGATR